jgi:hypothetical protein
MYKQKYYLYIQFDRVKLKLFKIMLQEIKN